MKSLSSFKTDSELELKGVWFDFGDFSILMGRAGGSNKKYTETLSKKMKPYIRQMQTALQTGSLSGHLREINTKIMMETFAETVVHAWTLKDDDGADVPCTYDSVLNIFREYPDLFDECSTQATNHANFLESLREETVKN
jgi:hypothetical protein